MRNRLGSLTPWALVVLLGLTALSRADDKTDAKTQPDPPGTGPIMNTLRSWFDQHDLNSDGFLDKQELAKAFRGPDAKPFDAGDAPKDPPKDPPPSESTSKNTPGDTTKPTTSKYAKYIDYQYLTLVDTNQDGQVSRDEFNTWARGYAVQVKQLEELNAKLVKMQQQLARQANAELQREARALQEQQRRMMAQQHQYLWHLYHHR